MTHKEALAPSQKALGALRQMGDGDLKGPMFFFLFKEKLSVAVFVFCRYAPFFLSCRVPVLLILVDILFVYNHTLSFHRTLYKSLGSLKLLGSSFRPVKTKLCFGEKRRRRDDV